MRKWTALVLALLGAAAIGLAFFLQSEANKNNMVNSILGRGHESSMAPWVAGGTGVLLLVLAALLLIVPTKVEVVSTPALAPGWYDDPESPSLVRYWDGATWTTKTANKA